MAGNAGGLVLGCRKGWMGEFWKKNMGINKKSQVYRHIYGGRK